ncbi:conserved Plasmodium protein, unknown function [Plasmodium relictum]|uniref:Uncharacterized protein n=1 Tax=Plasmodium relictum TaxID=85471 RepID=A0A1J1HBR4_PLARL|nr:conserved Plasmodium protein, unknown function [Plasmodium relictum]CRH02851.1 conserved Plasmodium protein, unknown function [Plasmodium relictum]
MTQIKPLMLDPIKQIKFVEKPRYYYDTSHIDIPCFKYIDKRCVDLHKNYIYKNRYLKKTIFVEKIKYIPKFVTKEKIIDVPQIVYKNKYVDKPIYIMKNKIISKPVNMVVEKVIPILKEKTKNKTKCLDEIEINKFLEKKYVKSTISIKNYDNNVIRACSILETLIKKTNNKNYKIFFIYLKSYLRFRKNVLGNNINYYNLNSASFLKNRNNENILNIKEEIEEYEKHDIFFNKEINKFICCILEENKSNLYNSCKEEVENEETPHIKNTKEPKKKINLNNYVIDHNIYMENENKPSLISKNNETENLESPVVIPYEYFIKGKKEEIHLLDGKLNENCNVLHPIFSDLNKLKKKENCNEIKISELHINLKVENRENFKKFYEKSYEKPYFEFLSNEESNNLNLRKKKENNENIYKCKRTMRKSAIIQNSNRKKREQNNNNTLEKDYKKKNINETLCKKNSSDSDLIIGNFIKNVRNDKLLYRHKNEVEEKFKEERKNENEILYINSLYNNNYSEQSNIKKIENDKMVDVESKKYIRNCYKLNKLLDYKKSIKEDETIFILLYKIINELKIHNNYTKNKKIEEKKIMYIYKAQNIIYKYKKLFENHSNNIQKLHYYLKKNEVILLKDILVYIVEVMNKIKREYKGMEKQIEKQILELEETICNRST